MTWIFSLDNGLSVKTETGTTKFKLKGGAKAFGCNQVEVKTTFKLILRLLTKTYYNNSLVGR